MHEATSNIIYKSQYAVLLLQTIRWRSHLTNSVSKVTCFGLDVRERRH